MLLLGIDLGTSSIKIAVVDHDTQRTITTVNYPEEETPILAAQPGWAEQAPDVWWAHIKAGIQKAHATGTYRPEDIRYIGIAYQMHGMILMDAEGHVLRNAIIWCDSRAVTIGENAFQDLGKEFLLRTHLNSPGNFTASKLRWVKENEPEIYQKAAHLLLPGDFIAYRFTNEISTTISALSEGVLWDFEKQAVSRTILDYYELHDDIIPPLHKVFQSHGRITAQVAKELGLNPQVEVTYKAGDQPNNALSLHVLNPGEVAATAGTSGVIYGITDQLVSDPQSRINTFAHVNYRPEQVRNGVLLCINGTGIANSWIRNISGAHRTYTELNELALQTDVGSKGLRIFPFGNGAERIFGNRILGGEINAIDYNRHALPEMARAVQEGIAFSFRYGLDIMRENGMQPALIRAGHNNLFLSPLFQEAFVATTDTGLELYKNDGSVGAALGAGIGASLYTHAREAFTNIEQVASLSPDRERVHQYEQHYQEWKEHLEQKLKTNTI